MVELWRTTRTLMKHVFYRDKGFRQAWEDNIAMLIYDELRWKGYTPKLKYDDRSEIAKKIMNMFLDS